MKDRSVSMSMTRFFLATGMTALFFGIVSRNVPAVQDSSSSSTAGTRQEATTARNGQWARAKKSWSATPAGSKPASIQLAVAESDESETPSPAHDDSKSSEKSAHASDSGHDAHSTSPASAEEHSSAASHGDSHTTAAKPNAGSSSDHSRPTSGAKDPKAAARVNELLKKAIEERRAEMLSHSATGTAVPTGTPSSQVAAPQHSSNSPTHPGTSSHGTLRSPGTELPGNPEGLTDSVQPGLLSDDHLAREKAQEYLRLRTQLQDLRDRLKRQRENPSRAELIWPSKPPAESPEDPSQGAHEPTIEHHGEQSPGDHHQSGSKPEPGNDFHKSPSETHKDPNHGADDHSAGHSSGAHGETAEPKSTQDDHSSVTDPHSSEAANPHVADAAHGHQNPPDESAADHHTDGHDTGSRAVAEDPNEHVGGHEAGEEAHANGHESESSDQVVLNHDVAQGPVDRVSLANNVYAVGQFELALSIYQEVQLDTLPPERQFWVEYQMANCLRSLGRAAEASNRYRALADQPEAGWISEQAAWWVSMLEKKRRLQKALADHTGPRVPSSKERQLPSADQDAMDHGTGSPGAEPHSALSDDASTGHSETGKAGGKIPRINNHGAAPHGAESDHSDAHHSTETDHGKPGH